MSTCKKCGATIVWPPKPGGPSAGFFPPQNPDGTPHKCEDQKPGPGAITGKLDSFTEGSATFIVKGGSRKTYAITPAVAREWKGAGFLMPPEVHADIWLEFEIDSKSFIKPGYRRVEKPDWGNTTPPATPAFRNGTDILKEGSAQQQQPSKGNAAEKQPLKETPCTSPAAAAAPQFPMPTHAELVAMVINNDTYWKAKALLEIERCEDIRKQTEVKNWQEAVGLAIEAYKTIDVEEGTDHLKWIEQTADRFHAFIQGKVGGA